MARSDETLRALITSRLVHAYHRDGAEIARLCDEVIDRSGNLLGWLREAASREQRIKPAPSPPNTEGR
jgi:hypothetical protein